MATFDDMDPERKITVYDKGFDETADGYGEYVTRSGDIWSPRVPSAEPLRLECEHFVDCVRDGREPSPRRAAACASCACSRALQASLDATRRGPAAQAATRRERAATTSAACSALSTGLIGIARCVRASSSVAGQLDAGGELGHRRLAVDRRAVVGLVADAGARERGGELVGALAAHDVEVPRGLAPPPATGSATSSPSPAAS